jgi:diguanylate cyclase (GGDEF)-like protein
MSAVKKILIIEDNLLQYRVTERMLANARIGQFASDWAQTYEDGLRLLLTGDYAACLLDYQLGELNGLDLLRAARAERCETPVIFLTADSSVQVDEAAMEAGALDYLVKGEITPRMVERSIRYTLKLSQAMRELHLLATRDALTGVLNRRAFDSMLREEVLRSRRFNHPLSLVIVDLDHFKSINDTHGHPAGDAALVEAARRLEAEVRGIDRVARIGGEEFAILLMETPENEAIIVAQRLVANMRVTPIAVAPGVNLTVTLSAGVSTLPIEAKNNLTLLEAADRALYQAKQSGRDRAVLAS